MELLVTEAARARLGDRLREVAPDVTLLLMTGEGRVVTEAGTEPDAADPDLFYASPELWPHGRLPELFRLMMAGTRGRWAQLFNAGLDHPTFRLLMMKGIRLCKSDAQSAAIAEYVTIHAMGLIHPLAEQARAQAARAWRRIPFREVGNTRWVIVGYGNIGQEVAKRAKAFGAQVTGLRRSPAPDGVCDRVDTLDALPDLLPRTDVLVFCAPLTPETRGLGNAALFAALPEGAVFVNVGRGELVDEAALVAGLAAGRPAHAVLDVFVQEPLPPESPFWHHPQVQMTSHCAGAGDGYLARCDALFLDNLGRYLRGAPLRNEARGAEVGL